MTINESARALAERLEAMYSHRGDGIPTQYVNPDGPEAATILRQLAQENEELRREIRYCSGSCTLDTLDALSTIGDGE